MDQALCVAGGMRSLECPSSFFCLFVFGPGNGSLTLTHLVVLVIVVVVVVVLVVLGLTLFEKSLRLLHYTLGTGKYLQKLLYLKL